MDSCRAVFFQGQAKRVETKMVLFYVCTKSVFLPHSPLPLFPVQVQNGVLGGKGWRERENGTREKRRKLKLDQTDVTKRSKIPFSLALDDLHSRPPYDDSNE